MIRDKAQATVEELEKELQRVETAIDGLVVCIDYFDKEFISGMIKSMKEEERKLKESIKYAKK